MRYTKLAVAVTIGAAAVLTISASPAQADSNSMLCVKGGGHIVVQTTYIPKGSRGVCQGGVYNGQVLWKHYTY
ncbi:hypothetical protein [Nocardia sp. AG03]|uniref:hypothetical protein n=1 Tax=Nocardia sp. AG03 TaxID=3025312 RepID=UPI00241836B6|nr:hypothetical protein [Nocardia sp. AG03]